ncbi:hypothetical protein KGA66_13040 [Actinocrinis puniceicyclus]|uniref:Uncharacterized protein n=1 Tax=Actinocrinis puniceicyclus TaxID=977794 RepID=A0A8J7WR32_9ACTN|nr:hypothetical protein [Actinocrinis puniceicyclus]MBS2963975.1 hypothetical protein [Actinocrinis puniceicyclus]
MLPAVQQGLFGANSAARGSAVARLVPPREVPAANSLGATVLLAGALFGPMAAGALTRSRACRRSTCSTRSG